MTKPTLRINEYSIEQAKAHDRAHGESVSEGVADYFVTLGVGTDRGQEKSTPLVDSLHGLLKDKGLDEESYKRHLVEKYG